MRGELGVNFLEQLELCLLEQLYQRITYVEVPSREIKVGKQDARQTKKNDGRVCLKRLWLMD